MSSRSALGALEENLVRPLEHQYKKAFFFKLAISLFGSKTNLSQKMLAKKFVLVNKKKNFRK